VSYRALIRLLDALPEPLTSDLGMALEVYKCGFTSEKDRSEQENQAPEVMLEDFVHFHAHREGFNYPNNPALGELLKEALIAFSASDWGDCLVITTKIQHHISPNGAELEWAAQKKDMLDFLLELNT
jgi:hypothetical protein